MLWEWAEQELPGDGGVDGRERHRGEGRQLCCLAARGIGWQGWAQRDPSPFGLRSLPLLSPSGALIEFVLCGGLLHT